MTTISSVENFRRGYRNEWTGTTHRSLLVSARNAFYRYSAVRHLRLGNHLSSDQPVSKSGTASAAIGGRRGSGRLKILRKGSARAKAGRFLTECRSHPARKLLGYRHINRFLACERADSLQSSHVYDSIRKRLFCPLFVGFRILSSDDPMVVIKSIARVDVRKSHGFQMAIIHIKVEAVRC